MKTLLLAFDWVVIPLSVLFFPPTRRVCAEIEVLFSNSDFHRLVSTGLVSISCSRQTISEHIAEMKDNVGRFAWRFAPPVEPETIAPLVDAPAGLRFSSRLSGDMAYRALTERLRYHQDSFPSFSGIMKSVDRSAVEHPAFFSLEDVASKVRGELQTKEEWRRFAQLAYKAYFVNPSHLDRNQPDIARVSMHSYADVASVADLRALRLQGENVFLRPAFIRSFIGQWLGRRRIEILMNASVAELLRLRSDERWGEFVGFYHNDLTPTLVRNFAQLLYTSDRDIDVLQATLTEVHGVKPNAAGGDILRGLLKTSKIGEIVALLLRHGLIRSFIDNIRRRPLLEFTVLLHENWWRDPC